MPRVCPHTGASQATNRESIQKSICRLDEDLSTLGQVSKLSESLSFPHQVWGWWPWCWPLTDTFPGGLTWMSSVAWNTCGRAPRGAQISPAPKPQVDWGSP